MKIIFTFSDTLRVSQSSSASPDYIVRTTELEYKLSKHRYYV